MRYDEKLRWGVEKVRYCARSEGSTQYDEYLFDNGYRAYVANYRTMSEFESIMDLAQKDAFAPFSRTDWDDFCRYTHDEFYRLANIFSYKDYLVEAYQNMVSHYGLDFNGKLKKIDREGFYTRDSVPTEDKVLEGLSGIIPSLTNEIPCPGCDDGLPDTLYKAIICLNDFHEWSRERIAQWTESLSLDLSISLT